MQASIRVKMCCHSASQPERFEARLGDIVLLRDQNGYAEGEVVAILSAAEVHVSIAGAAPKRIAAAEILAVMLGE